MNPCMQALNASCKKRLRAGEDATPPDDSTSQIISRIFAASIKIFFFFAAATWLWLDVLNHFVPSCFFLTYLPAILSGLMAMIPVIPSFIVFLPSMAQLWLEGWPGFALLHLALHLALWSVCVVCVYEPV